MTDVTPTGVGNDTTDVVTTDVVDDKDAKDNAATTADTITGDFEAKAAHWKAMSRKNEESFKTTSAQLKEKEAELASLQKQYADLSDFKTKFVADRRTAIAKETGFPESALEDIDGEDDEAIKASIQAKATKYGIKLLEKGNVSPLPLQGVHQAQTFAATEKVNSADDFVKLSAAKKS